MVIERVYNIPLRKGFRLAARQKKSKKAIRVLKEFLSRHLKQSDMKKIYIGKNLNEELWKHGIKNPPGQVKVVVIKQDNGDVNAELYGHQYTHKKKEQKEDSKEDTKLEEKSKEAKAKSSSAEKKHEHVEHVHDSKDVHSHDEKHEHAARVHEARPELATPKKTTKKKSE